MIKQILILALMLASIPAFGQGAVPGGMPVVTNGLGQPIPNAKVAVCATDPGPNPVSVCGSLATIYTDITTGTLCTGVAGTQLLNNWAAPSVGSGCSNPGLADQNGNVVVFAAPGTYFCEFYGPTIIGINVQPCATLGGGGGGGVPGGLNTQIQFNNAGVFAGLSNVAVGSVLVSKGTSTIPAFQLKPALDVRDFGVVGDGVTDDTTAMQNAANAACVTPPAISRKLIAPAYNFVIKISSTLTFSKCFGVMVDFGNSQGQTPGSTTANGGSGFLWAGAANGTVILIDQVRDSIFQNFFIHSATADFPLKIDEIAPVTGITSNDQFNNISISAFSVSAHSTTYVGIQICLVAPGNCENLKFNHLQVECEAGGAPLDPTNLGKGIWLAGGQPNWVEFHDVGVRFCSRGFQLDAGIVIDIDGGNTGTNWTDLYMGASPGTQLVSYRNSRSEGSHLPVVIAGGTDLTLDHLSYSGVITGPVISYSAPGVGTRLSLSHSTFTDNLTAVSGPTSASATLDSLNNSYPSAFCPDLTRFSKGRSILDNCVSADTLAFSPQNLQDQFLYLTSFGKGVAATFAAPSPPLVLSGSFFNTNDDATYIRHQPILNLTKSYIAFGHPSALSTLNISLPPVIGGLSTSALTVTPIITSVLPLGTTGGTTYTYVIGCNDGAGGHTPSSSGITTNIGNASLSSTNFNQINWQERSGCYNYSVYRTVGGATQGLIGTAWSSANTATGYFFKDTGLVGDGATAPATNTSGASSLGPTTVSNLIVSGLAPATLTDAATITWAIAGWSLQNATVTLGGNRTLNITGPVSGGNYVLRIVQDGTGTRTLALGTGCTWKVFNGGAGAITLSAAAGAIDVMTFYYDGTNCYANLGNNYN